MNPRPRVIIRSMTVRLSCVVYKEVKWTIFGIGDPEASGCWYYSGGVWNNYKDGTPPLSWFCVMPGDSLLNEFFLLHRGQTADSIRKMIMRYLLLSLRAPCHVLRIEWNHLDFKKPQWIPVAGLKSGGGGWMNFLQTKAARKKFHQFMSITRVWESRSIKQIISTDRLSMHILPGRHRRHMVSDMFSGQSLGDVWTKKLKKSFLLSSREWAQWNTARRHLTPCLTVAHGARIRQRLFRITNLKAHTAWLRISQH